MSATNYKNIHVLFIRFSVSSWQCHMYWSRFNLFQLSLKSKVEARRHEMRHQNEVPLFGKKRSLGKSRIIASTSSSLLNEIWKMWEKLINLNIFWHFWRNHISKGNLMATFSVFYIGQTNIPHGSDILTSD